MPLPLSPKTDRPHRWWPLGCRDTPPRLAASLKGVLTGSARKGTQAWTAASPVAGVHLPRGRVPRTVAGLAGRGAHGGRPAVVRGEHAPGRQANWVPRSESSWCVFGATSVRWVKFEDRVAGCLGTEGFDRGVGGNIEVLPGPCGDGEVSLEYGCCLFGADFVGAPFEPLPPVAQRDQRLGPNVVNPPDRPVGRHQPPVVAMVDGDNWNGVWSSAPVPDRGQQCDRSHSEARSGGDEGVAQPPWHTTESRRRVEIPGTLVVRLMARPDLRARLLLTGR